MVNFLKFHGGRACSALLVSGLLWGLSGCGINGSETSPNNADGGQQEAGNAQAADDRPVSDDPKAQLQADLEDAISLLKKGDVALFLERYMPVEELESIREFTTIERHAKNLKVGGEFEKLWLGRLKAIKKAEVEFLDEERSKAKLVADLSPEETASELSVPNPAEEKIPKTEGFSGDLPEAIEKAIAALEAGEHRKFIENMFPESELYLTQSKESMDALLARLKEHPEMVEHMVSDLKVLQKQTPKYNAEKTIATFRFPEHTRTIHFEKAGTWRMANTAKQIRADVYKQSKRPPIGLQSLYETEWVRIRDHWRLNDLPEANGQ